METTDKTLAEKAKAFDRAARHVYDLASTLNSSFSKYNTSGSFFATHLDEAEAAIADLEKLIANREYEILQAQEAIEAYRKAITDGGLESRQELISRAWNARMGMDA